MSEEKKTAQKAADEKQNETQTAEPVKEEKTAPEEKPEETSKPETEAKPEDAQKQELSEFEKAQQALAKEHDSYLRLAAEYDNFRKRSQREKDNLYTDIRAETVGKFLPVYDNLERALKQETADDAFKKGVEMTMTQLRSVLEKLGITEIPALGQPFDPNFHNAVMHMEDEAFGENIVAEVFQAGFKLGEKVIRHALVKVAN